MSTQIITIGPDGSLVGLDHKRKGLDLRQFGKADIQRATLIQWDGVTNQNWFIRWVVDGEAVDLPWSQCEEFGSVGLDCRDFGGCFVPIGGSHYPTAFFKDYEDAVAAEVAVIQARQLAGEPITH